MTAPHCQSGRRELFLPVFGVLLSALLARPTFGFEESHADGQPPVERPAVEEPAAEARAPAPPLPIELQPYRVQVQIGFERDAQFGDEFRRSVLEGVRDGLDRYVGDFWQATVAEEQGRLYTGLAALNRLRFETIPATALPADLHKVYLLAVQADGARFRVAGRECDTVTRQLGPLAVQLVSETSEISEALLAVMRDVFRPVAAVEISKAGVVTLRARGGEFPPRDAGWLPLQPGRAYEVHYCYLNKDRDIERVQQVPFTYVTMEEEVGRGVARAVVTSGLRAPLTARRRIQPLALGINQRRPETRLTMVTRPPARKPLGGVEVEISPVPTRPEDAPKKSEEAGTKDSGAGSDASRPAKLPRLVADRAGLVTLSASLAPDGKPVWLFVKSGQALLARVPIVPGAQAGEVLELPDDTLRLEIEGSIATLQAELVDTVARRAVLMAMARSRAKSAQWEAVAATLKQLDEMPTAAAFAVNINAIRQPALKAARTRRDRTTEERVKKLCDEAIELVNNYLDTEKLRELKEELNEMRQIAADEAAAEAKSKAGGGQPEPGVKKKTKKKSAPPPAQPAPRNPPPAF
jgi:hypothetical protein